MTEQKRPVLTLKRKTEGETPTRSRKTIINVTTPPKWKVKKQKLAEKAAREAELAAKKAQARQALSIYLTLPSLDEAVNTLKPWWPGLFDGNTPRLLACGIREVLLDEVSQRNIPLSHKKLRRALKAITRSESYLGAMKAGACRYDTEGYVTEHITQEEEQYGVEFYSTYSGAEMEIGFNVSYVLDVLNALKCENVRMMLTDSVSSVQIEDAASQSAAYVVMPMRL